MRDKSGNSKNCKKRSVRLDEEHGNGTFPDMMDENWKPSFKEVAKSKSWTEHLMMYFTTFCALLYLATSPDHWMGWLLLLLTAAALTAGYWAAMVNFNRHYIGRANRQLLREKRRLEMLERDLHEDAQKTETTIQHGTKPDMSH